MAKTLPSFIMTSRNLSSSNMIGETAISFSNLKAMLYFVKVPHANPWVGIPPLPVTLIVNNYTVNMVRRKNLNIHLR